MYKTTVQHPTACFVIMVCVFLVFAPNTASATQAGAPAKSATPPATSSGTEVKAGLVLEKRELTAAADSFEIAPEAKIFAWAKVRDVAPGSTVSIAFKNGDKEAYKKEFPIPSVPYRIYANRTFRTGDGGDWKIVVSGPDGKELGSTTFKVTIKK